MTLADFERQVYAVAADSPICGIPVIRRLTPTSINLRLEIIPDGFIDAFYNDRTDTLAFALIEHGTRIFGSDNAGGWHIHPFDDPERHDPLPCAMSFRDFVTAIEQHLTASR
jgi:hypothetical protein